MAEEPVHIDTDPLHSAAARYLSKAHQLRQVGLDLSNLGSSYSYAFGGDDSGDKVSGQFYSMLKGFQESLQLLVRVVDGTADGVNAMRLQYNRVEEHNAKLAKRLGEGSLIDSFDGPSPGSNPNSGGGGDNPTNGGGGGGNNHNGRH